MLFRGAHFINNRRLDSRWAPRAIFIMALALIMLTVSTATWLFLLHVPSQLGVAVLGFYILALTVIIAIKPQRLSIMFRLDNF